MQPGNSVSGMHDCAVIIIGGGPCGLVLAIELGRRGVSTIVLEEKTSPARFPAANATQARTMEHYRRLGFAEKVRAQGLPADYPTDIAYFTRYTKHELARFSLPSARAARELVRTLTGSWSAAELDGEHEPARPAANDDDGAIVHPTHGIPRLHDLKL